MREARCQQSECNVRGQWKYCEKENRGGDISLVPVSGSGMGNAKPTDTSPKKSRQKAAWMRRVDDDATVGLRVCVNETGEQSRREQGREWCTRAEK